MSTPRSLRLHGWRHPAVVSAAALAFAAGYAQFSVTAALADVAAAFGELGSGGSLRAQVGLSGTTLGVGLAVIRLASLGGLPLAALADRVGRRRLLLACTAAGLATTGIAAASPSFWWFVIIFALGRPMLSATNAVAGVVAAEETRTADRTKAIALIAATYGLGAGSVALARAVAGDVLGFRGVFALALVLLAALPLISRFLREPDRFAGLHEARPQWTRPMLGLVGANLVPRLLLLAALTGAVAFVTGPANAFVFLYGEGVLGASRAQMFFAVLAAGPTGLAGLLLGRWCADLLGRRVTAAVAQVILALAGILTYVGTLPALYAGYVAATFAASAYGPPAGALAAELFPTSVRGTAAGWLTAAGVLGAVLGLLAFGALRDTLASFGATAAILFVPVAAASALFAWLPETRGLELEQTAPESG